MEFGQRKEVLLFFGGSTTFYSGYLSTPVVYIRSDDPVNGAPLFNASNQMVTSGQTPANGYAIHIGTNATDPPFIESGDGYSRNLLGRLQEHIPEQWLPVVLHYQFRLFHLLPPQTE